MATTLQKKQRFLPVLIAVLLMSFMGLLSCEEVVPDPPTPDPDPDELSIVCGDYKLTAHKNQTGDTGADALQAQFTHTSEKYNVNLYGTFDVNYDPDTLKTITYKEESSDTTAYLLLSPATGRLQTAYIDVKGVKQPWVLRHQYLAGNDSAMQVSVHEYDWGGQSGELRYEAIFKNINGDIEQTPVFGLKKGTAAGFSDDPAASLATGVTVAQTALYGKGGGYAAAAFPDKVDAAGGTIRAVAEAIAATATIAELLATNACAQGLQAGMEAYPEGTVVENPSVEENDPTQQLPPSACGDITFTVAIDTKEGIELSDIEGGTAPYESGIADPEALDGVSVPDGPPGANCEVVFVRDAKGCVVFEKVCTVILAMHKMEIVGGNNQMGEHGEPLAQPLEVKVTDLSGIGVINVNVEWKITSGGGTLSAAESLTDDKGVSRVQWTLGSSEIQKAEAVVTKLDGSLLDGAPLAFNATTGCQVTRITEDDGDIIELEYDEHGNVIKETRLDKYYSQTQVPNEITTYAYNEDNVLLRTDLTSFGDDPDENYSSYALYEYNSSGKVSKITEYDSEGVSSYHHTYDSSNRLIELLQNEYGDLTSVTIEYFFNTENVSVISVYGSDGSLEERTIYESYNDGINPNYSLSGVSRGIYFGPQVPEIGFSKNLPGRITATSFGGDGESESLVMDFAYEYNAAEAVSKVIRDAVKGAHNEYTVTYSNCE